jgi:exodeoxyribonuclease V alpha subunit
LLAPTGKAARRMSEATGYAAQTIHSRLKLTPGHYDTEEELHGLVIVDEVSMLDTVLAAVLLAALSPSATILLVGDPDQLPSVGPGAVLRDLIRIGQIPRVQLTRVFRNDAGVAINAAHIRAGEMIQSLPDCAVIETETAEETADRIIRYVARERPENLLVLVPTNDGPMGRYALCRELQAVLNAERLGTGMVFKRDRFEEEIRVGDRIMMTRNDSEAGYYNGDQGVIEEVSVPRYLDVRLDGDRLIRLTGDRKRDCTLAYAITGHKSQGSEAATVIVAVQPSRVLSREWLYTAMTRGKKQVYLVGDPRAIEQAIRVVRTPERRTGLVEAVGETL